MNDIKVNNDQPNRSNEHTKGKENKQALKRYRVSLLTTPDKQREVSAASAREADAVSAVDAVFGTFEIAFSLDSKTASLLIPPNEPGVEEGGWGWFGIGKMFSRSFIVEVLEGDTWRPCIEDY
jgi:hypothetical protein